MELYHYTSIDTLEKILSNQTFRFTNMKDLNDSTEYSYGVNLLKKSVLEFEKRNGIMDEIDLSMFDRFMFDGQLYSVSFTECEDDIVYWNSHYITPNKSVSIAVESNYLFDENVNIYKCIYTNPYINMCKERYVYFKRLFKYPFLIPEDGEWKQFTYQTAFLKQGGFSSEKEWRGVVFPLKNISTFNRNGRRCKYFDYNININGINRIIIGPSNYQNENIHKVNNLLRLLNLNIHIESSKLPLVL